MLEVVVWSIGFTEKLLELVVVEYVLVLLVVVPSIGPTLKLELLEDVDDQLEVLWPNE